MRLHYLLGEAVLLVLVAPPLVEVLAVVVVLVHQQRGAEAPNARVEEERLEELGVSDGGRLVQLLLRLPEQPLEQEADR